MIDRFASFVERRPLGVAIGMLAALIALALLGGCSEDPSALKTNAEAAEICRRAGRLWLGLHHPLPSRPLPPRLLRKVDP